MPTTATVNCRRRRCRPSTCGTRKSSPRSAPRAIPSTMLDALIAAGVDIVRLNFSHGTHESHGATYRRVREAAARAQAARWRSCRILAVRRSAPAGSKADARSRSRPGDHAADRDRRFRRRTGTRLDDVRGAGAGRAPRAIGCCSSDGPIELRVEESDGKEIRTTVVEGGMLGEHKGINAPGVALPASAITPKDVDDLQFGLSLGVDMVAVSFVQTAADLRQARELMARRTAPDVPLVAKLERPQALDASGRDSGGVRRGDGRARRSRASRCRSSACRARRRRSPAARGVRQIPVILATQVLESMTTEAASDARGGERRRQRRR